jgi:crotonobetainyl-CoA:carnitine CoA-transferase CaiB-like acyl-CoA transferase
VQALDGVRVVELATVFAGPGTAKYLGDFGADVIKVEAPTGDGVRGMGWRDPRDDQTFVWKILGRNKRTVVLDLKTDAGLESMRRLVDTADVLIENLRPGILERLGLDPRSLFARNPGLVVLRVTGFGQTGPYASRPGFATLAEAMGGFAAINGEPDGPPLLPPIALTDELAALVGAFATLAALRHRDRTGEGQTIDVNLLESMLQVMGPLPSVWAELGELQPRLGSGIPYSVPRGTYQCSDGVWVAVSTSAESVAHRLLGLLGVGDQERFATFEGRTAHRDELDLLVRDWIAARPSDDVLAEFEAVEAAIAPVYTMADLLADDHVLEREAIVEVDGVHMQGPVARLSRTPGRVRHAGRPLGADTDVVLALLAGGRPVWRGADGDSGAEEAGPGGRDASRGGSA